MSFVGLFFLLVLGVGAAELYLLVFAASRIGFGVTLALCVLTGLIGGALVRHQGLRTLSEIQRSLGRGEVPAVTIVSGVTILLVGVMLILPGFVTDTLCFLLLIPPLRLAAAGLLVRHFRGRAGVHTFHSFDAERGPVRVDVIDVEQGPSPPPPEEPPRRVIDVTPEE